MSNRFGDRLKCAHRLDLRRHRCDTARGGHERRGRHRAARRGKVTNKHVVPRSLQSSQRWSMRFLGIDLGSSFIKGAVLDLAARSFDHVRRRPFPGPLPNLPPQRFEVEPHQVVAATRALIEELLLMAPDCAGLVMCSQMHSLVLTDDRGESLSNIITWRDQRALEPHPSGSSSVFEHLRQAIDPEEHLALGNELRPGLPLGVLFWLAVRGELPNGAIPVALPDFVLTQLCHALPGCEPTIAAAQGAFDLRTGDWHWPLLARLGLG